MKFFRREEAIRQMNFLGAQDKPFLFVIDYAMEHSYVNLLDEIPEEEVLYSFPSWSNDRGKLRATTELSLNREPVCGHTPLNVVWNVMPESEEAYRHKFDLIQKHQNAGDCFLANLTCRIPVSTNLSLIDIYMHSKAMYKLWFKSRFVCFSPEIFIRIENGTISGYPMKGTIDASLPDAETRLMSDQKEAAEHATIVDLIRNDLSKVSTRVRVPRYRYVDRLSTNKGEILQTSSHIEGDLPGDYREHIGDIVFSQLPAGSITGAPKKRTVEIIGEAEDYNRGFYTGVMGVCCAGRVESAVMIRYIEEEKSGLFFKAGGGITSQSQCKSEYEEVIQKAYVPIY